MAKCERCGNEYDKAFIVEAAGAAYIRQFRVRHPCDGSYL
jgi:hypothetical protein